MLDVRELGFRGKFFVIAGPCVIEGSDFLLSTARRLKEITSSLHVPFVFKSSYDKANRTSLSSFRGPGLEQGLKDLELVRWELDVPVLTDVHSVPEAEAAGRVVDVLQIPAFLARQTDLLAAAARTGRVVNVKKAQFMSPAEMAHAVQKIRESGPDPGRPVWLTERGFTFGYNNLVVDFRSIPEMKRIGQPVVFDATHSVQQPGGMGAMSGGTREHVPELARAAAAVGVDGLFMEVHPDPPNAKSDAATQVDYDTFQKVVHDVLAIRKALGF